MNRILRLTLILLALAPPALAGVVYEIETTDHDASPPRTESTTMMAEGGNLKMGIADPNRGRDGEMIFRGDRREMMVVDHGEKSYMVIDEAMIRQLGGQVSQAMEQMKKALENVPEEQRALVEKMMKEHGGMGGATSAPTQPTTKVRRSGERAEKGGYPCVKYDVLRDGQKVRELWVTGWDNVEGGDEAKAAFEEMAAFFEQMMDGLGAASGPFGNGFDNPFASMREINGFPVVSRELDDGSLESESTLRSARRQRLDPADFEPPAGYKRQQMLGVN